MEALVYGQTNAIGHVARPKQLRRAHVARTTSKFCAAYSASVRRKKRAAAFGKAAALITT